MTFAEFLARARRVTYAIPEGTPLGDGTEHMAYDDGPWRYRDRYAGHNPYGGQEIVWKNGVAIWLKNYMADILSDVCPMNDVYAFQRRALGQPDPDNLMRGPSSFDSGPFRYRTDIQGDIERFFGSEMIFFDETPVYRMILHGGMINHA